MASIPQTLGLRRSFGFGDRLGLATPGHIDAVRGTSFAPIFAQQSIREMTRTQRTPDDVMRSARAALEREGWNVPWGADADHLQTREDVFRTAAAGFCYFTIDPSAHVNNDADNLRGKALDDAYGSLVKAGMVNRDEASDLYGSKTFDLDAGRVAFDDPSLLRRAVVKYGGALAYTKKMGDWIADACGVADACGGAECCNGVAARGARPFEIEMSVDETRVPTSPLEHLFVALELRRLGVKVVALAPRFVGDFEKGIDYKGDLALFEQHYKLHAEIASRFGPYKLSIHSGSDKFSIYPIIGRVSGERLHVKTAGTSYLEALRVACRVDRPLLREIVAFCRGRYETDKATYHVSARLADVPEFLNDPDLERSYLDEPAGREILHVTYGSVLSAGKMSDGAPLKEKILDVLTRNDALYREVLRIHLGKHLRLLG